MASATPSYASTKETKNFAHLCRLLVDVGSQALRDKFDSIHPPAGLHGVLTKPPAHTTLQMLRKKRILNPTQWAKLYPPTSSVSSNDFDVTLLMLLLRNICGLTPPATGWDSLPPATDNSAEANIARVRYYRNQVCGHASQASVDDSTFHSYWQDINNALVGLGADAAAITKLKTESMDPVIEKHYQVLLREWKKDEDNIKDSLDEIEDQQKLMDDQILETKKEITGMLESLMDPDKGHQDRENTRDRFKEVKVEMRAIREKLDELTPTGQGNSDKGAFDPTELIDTIRQLYKVHEGWIAPFPWCEEFQFNLDDIFTRLNTVSWKKERRRKTGEAVTINDIFKTQEDCLRPRTVLIEGKPGIGKTTFCDKIAYDWATKKNEKTTSSGRSFPQFQVVLSLKCRDIRPNVSKFIEGIRLPLAADEEEKFFESSLWDAIDDQLLPRDVTKEEKENFFEFIRHNWSGVLLVLDGWDELPTNMSLAFQNFIRQQTMLPKCRLVVTAKHEVGIKVRKCFDRVLEVKGFTNEDAGDFIVKYFKTKPELASKLLNQLDLDGNLKQLTNSPLYTALLCLLCEDIEGIFPQSGAQLFLEIVECLLRRYRKNKGLPHTNCKDLTIVYKTQLKQLGRIAWRCLLHDVFFFEKSEFENYADELTEYGFLSCKRGLGPGLYYFFSHRTFQEMFAAFYLCDEVLDDRICAVHLIADNQYFNKLKEVLVFTCGLIALQSEKNIETIVTSMAGQIDNGDKFVVALKCLQECRSGKNYSLYLRLAGTLGSFLNITQLNQPDIGDVDVDYIALAEVIQHNSTITELDLSQNHLGDGDCTALAEAIKHNSTITQLNLSDNSLGPGDCTALAEAIKHNSTIKQLNLSDNSLCRSDCTALAQAIKHNSTITQLDLSRNFLGDGDFTTLAEAIKHNSTITQLDLSRNFLFDGDFTALAEAIKHNSTITQLDLSRNFLCDGDFTALAEAIKHNSTITQLDLSDNSLGRSDCTALAEAIKHNSTIKQLNLSDNFLGAGDCTALAKAIKHNSTITQLDLSDNFLFDDCTALAEAIKHNSIRKQHATITQMDFSELRTGTAPSEEDFTEVIPRVQAGTQLPPLAIEHKLKNIVTKTIVFEANHRECVRVLPYSDGGHAKVYFYVLSQFNSGKSGVPQKLKDAAQKYFGDMEVELQWFDLYNDVTKILKAPPVEFSSGKPKRLNESQVYEINETIKRNLHVLVRHHNITAVQASFKITKFQQTIQPCIAIYVLRKGFIPDGEFPLPRRLGCYPVDVVDGFWFRVNPDNQDGPWTPNKAQKQRKVLKLGASIGVKGIEASGSLGAIVEADGNFYALSCDHVMKDPLESEIIHPALNDHLNYLNYHLQEYGTRIKHILKRESLFDLETHFSFDTLRTELELLEKFKELKSIKEKHRDPEKAKGKRLKNLEIHEKALEKGFRQPRVIGTYVAGVSRNFRWTDGQEYYIDAAVAQLTADEVNKLRDSETVEVIGTGDIPSGECSEILKAEGELCKSGRTTGYTRSGRHEDPSIFAKSPLYEVSAQNMQLMDVLRRVKLCHSCTMRSGVSERVTSSVPFCDSCIVDTRTLSEWLWLKNCLCVDRPGDVLKEGQGFSAEGDSGAVLFEKVPGKDLLGFGIIFGEVVTSAQIYTIASPLRVALEALSSELYDNANLRLLSNYND